jgi:hypothetical protein
MDYSTYLLPPSGTNTKWRCRKWIPRELHDRVHLLPEPYTGRKVLIKTTGTPDKTDARRVARSIIDEFERMVEAIRPIPHEWVKLAQPPRVIDLHTHELSPEAAARLLAAIDTVQPGIPWALKRPGQEGIWGAAATSEPARPIVDVTPETPVVDAEMVIEAWLDERAANRNPIDPNTSDGRDKIKNKRRKLAHVFAWTGKSNVAAITEADMIAYRARHIREDRENGTVKTRDYLIDVKALFAVAKSAGLITVDVAADLPVPPRTDRVTPPFSDEEARVILEAARHAPDVQKWANWLSAFTTAHNKEILHAHADEFYRLEDGTLVWDMRGRKLKTAARLRILSIHSSLVREGFGKYLETRRGSPLFDGSPDYNDTKLNEMIVAAFAAAGIKSDKRFYAWRKRNTDRIGKLRKDDSLADYINGHSAKGISGKYYRFHELPEDFGEIISTIEKLVDPTLKMAA